MNELTNQNNLGIMETVLIKGDLSELTADERSMYYLKVCESIGLNPLTKPFDYVELQKGKLTLYAKKDCTEQLRKIHGINIEITSREIVGDCYIVTAKATDKNGRFDESIGAISFTGRRKDFKTNQYTTYTMEGEQRANAIMTAETKAKRRVTLSIAGLGMLDEYEVDSIPGATVKPVALTSRTPMSDKTYDAIGHYMGYISVSDDIVGKWLAKGGVSTISELTEEQGQKIVDWFKKEEEKLEHDLQSKNQQWNDVEMEVVA